MNLRADVALTLKSQSYGQQYIDESACTCCIDLKKSNGLRVPGVAGVAIFTH
jgi:hypothetical protein